MHSKYNQKTFTAKHIIKEYLVKIIKNYCYEDITSHFSSQHCDKLKNGQIRFRQY